MSDSSTSAAHVPTASSPSAVLQLSYEAVSGGAANPANPHEGVVQLSPEQVAEYTRTLEQQGECGVKPFFLAKFETESVKNWDRFYRKNADRFYKDRHYLTNEFKELADTLEADRIARGEPEPVPEASPSPSEADMDEPDAAPPSSSPSSSSSSGGSSATPWQTMRPITEPTARPAPGQRRLLEVGCGVGNAMFPLLRVHPTLFIYGIDCSKNAIQCVQNHPDYEAAAGQPASLPATTDGTASSADAASHTAAAASAPVEAASSDVSVRSGSGGRCGAWVVDVVGDDFPAVMREDHLDFATLIFVLSAIHPSKMTTVLAKVHRALKKNEGVLFIRDYCMYDLAQLRFAKTSKLGPSWYVRQDGTRSYFFTLEELSGLLQQVGFEVIEALTVCKRVVNRKEKSAMSRRFVQIRAKAMDKQSGDEMGAAAGGQGEAAANTSSDAAAAAAPALASQSSS